MQFTVCEYRGYRMSLYSSDEGHTVLVHADGIVFGFARSSREEGLRVAFKKACAMVDEAHRQNTPQDVPISVTGPLATRQVEALGESPKPPQKHR
jgi:hypothetical protein